MNPAALLRGAGATLVRHGIPLFALAALAWGLVARVIHTGPPTDAAHAHTIVRLVWVYAGSAWIVQLALVGAAAPLVGRQLTQLRGARAAVMGLARGALPVAAATVAVLVGGVALVVPGVVLLVLLSLAGASTARTIPAALVDSAEHVRRAPLAVLVVVATMLAIDLGIAAAVLHGVATLPAKGAKPVQLATYRAVLAQVTGALGIVSPIIATLLAQCYALTTPVLTALAPPTPSPSPSPSPSESLAEGPLPALERAPDPAQVDGPRLGAAEPEAL